MALFFCIKKHSELFEKVSLWRMKNEKQTKIINQLWETFTMNQKIKSREPEALQEVKLK